MLYFEKEKDEHIVFDSVDSNFGIYKIAINKLGTHRQYLANWKANTQRNNNLYCVS